MFSLATSTSAPTAGWHAYLHSTEGLSSESATGGLISNQKLFPSLCLSPPFLLVALSVAFNTVYYPLCVFFLWCLCTTLCLFIYLFMALNKLFSIFVL